MINFVSTVWYQYGNVQKPIIEKLGDSHYYLMKNEVTFNMYLKDFSLLVFLVVWHDILFEINLLVKIIQIRSAGISLAFN